VFLTFDGLSVAKVRDRIRASESHCRAPRMACAHGRSTNSLHLAVGYATGQHTLITSELLASKMAGWLESLVSSHFLDLR
jgi:hypothetical protein